MECHENYVTSLIAFLAVAASAVYIAWWLFDEITKE